jgi:ubiquinone/menaquinone biosynthesis C-methylase UbiE
MKTSCILFGILVLKYLENTNSLVSFLSNFTRMRRIGISGLSQVTSLSAKKVRASDVLKAPQWPKKWPYRPQDFSRQDESSDSQFYDQPRLVYHIDDYAVDALTQYYDKNIPAGSDILDICSSWVSHLPKDKKLGKVTGLGMNQKELEENVQLTDFVVQDLNINPTFPFKDNSYDFVTCVVSVDYLNQPLEVFSEISRVLKPGGICLISQSNRCFPTKAIQIWLQTNDFEHIFIIGSYFHYAQTFEAAEAEDISPNPGRSDPLFIIRAKAK